MPGIPFSSWFTKVNSCETAIVAQVAAGGDHSFLFLDLQLPKKAIISATDVE